MKNPLIGSPRKNLLLKIVRV